MKLNEVLKTWHLDNIFEKIVNVFRKSFLILFLEDQIKKIQDTRNKIFQILHLVNSEEKDIEINNVLIQKIKNIQNLGIGIYDLDGYEVEKIESVITPTDEIERKGSRRIYNEEKDDSHNKLEIILNLLKDENIKKEDIKIKIGKLDNSIRRLGSYILIYLSELNKLIFLCEEAGSTFIMDKEEDKDLDFYINLTKQEKLEEGATPLSWEEEKKWGNNIKEILFLDKTYNTTFNYDEEWENFCETEDFHIGTIHAIATKIVREDKKIEIESFDKEVKRVEDFLKENIQEKNIQVKEEVLDIKGHRRDGYAWEDLIEIIEVYKNMLKTNIGENFFIDENGETWKTLNAIAKENDLHSKTVILLVGKLQTQTRNEIFEIFGDLINEETFVSQEVKGAHSVLFSESRIVPIVNRYKSILLSEQEGEWGSFASKNNSHFGVIPRIVNKLKSENIFVNRGFVETLITENNLLYEWILSGNKDIKKGWNYEEIKEIVLASHPISKEEGEWSGFFIEGGKHFATVRTLNKKLGIKSLHHFNKLKEYLKNVIPITDSQGHKRDGYCIEEIYEKLIDPNIKDILGNAFEDGYPF
jgi:hypothetical protein